VTRVGEHLRHPGAECEVCRGEERHEQGDGGQPAHVVGHQNFSGRTSA
jgi:hypothetical protein